MKSRDTFYNQILTDQALKSSHHPFLQVNYAVTKFPASNQKVEQTTLLVLVGAKIDMCEKKLVVTLMMQTFFQVSYLKQSFFVAE